MICTGRDSAHMRSHSFRLLIIAALLLSILIVSSVIGDDPSTEALEIVDSTPLVKDSRQVFASAEQGPDLMPVAEVELAVVSLPDD